MKHPFSVDFRYKYHSHSFLLMAENEQDAIDRALGDYGNREYDNVIVLQLDNLPVKDNRENY